VIKELNTFAKYIISASTIINKILIQFHTLLYEYYMKSHFICLENNNVKISLCSIYH